jgi:hypothetical protein
MSVFTAFLFLLGIHTLFVFPGYIILRAVLRGKIHHPLLRYLVAFLLGFSLLTFGWIALSYFHIPLHQGFFVVYSVVSTAACVFLYRNNLKENFSSFFQRTESSSTSTSPVLHTSLLIILTLLFATKGVMLWNAMLPSATDMGHHTYWIADAIETGLAPTYAKQELITEPTIRITPPQAIPDFIIGEHLAPAALASLIGTDMFHGFPMLWLLWWHLLALLAVAYLSTRAWQLYVGDADADTLRRTLIITLLLLGILGSFASPQGKFVSGGVVGNIMGNLFIPVILTLVLEYLKAPKKHLVALILTLCATLAYTHHLSTFILAFSLFGVAAVYILCLVWSLWGTWANLGEKLLAYLKTLISIPTLLLLGIIVLFVVLAPPSYLNADAIGGSVGTPDKSTRTGLSFYQYTDVVGWVRLALALVGVALTANFLWLGRRMRDIRALPAVAITLGTLGILSVMALFPQIALVNIPSARVGSYLLYPATVLATIALLYLWSLAREDGKRKGQQVVFVTLLITLGIFVFAQGIRDNRTAWKEESGSRGTVQTLAAGQYLVGKVEGDEQILKDHNYLDADAWLKHLYLKDYNYPLSRGFLKRYEEDGSRDEKCTLDMISNPSSTHAIECYNATGVRYVIVNPNYDRSQFETPDRFGALNFSLVYRSADVSVYRRN